MVCSQETPTGRAVRLSSVHDAPELHLAEALECFVASDASAVVEHTKQCASPCLLPVRQQYLMTHVSANTAMAQQRRSRSHCQECGQRDMRSSPAARGCTISGRPRICAAPIRVIVLEDNDVVHLRAGAYGIFNASITERHTAVPRLLETLNMEVSQIMKGGYDTFMQARLEKLLASLLSQPSPALQVHNNTAHRIKMQS